MPVKPAAKGSKPRPKNAGDGTLNETYEFQTTNEVEASQHDIDDFESRLANGNPARRVSGPAGGAHAAPVRRASKPQQAAKPVVAKAQGGQAPADDGKNADIEAVRALRNIGSDGSDSDDE